jgi:hypothetical protein
LLVRNVDDRVPDHRRIVGSDLPAVPRPIVPVQG